MTPNVLPNPNLVISTLFLPLPLVDLTQNRYPCLFLPIEHSANQDYRYQPGESLRLTSFSSKYLGSGYVDVKVIGFYDNMILVELNPSLCPDFINRFKKRYFEEHNPQDYAEIPLDSYSTLLSDFKSAADNRQY